MRKLILTLILTVLIAGCGQMAVWSLAGSDLENEQSPVAARVGIVDNTLEMGLEVSYLEGARNDSIIGAYAIESLVVDSNGITPYIGAQATICDNDVRGGYYGPITGILTPLSGNIQSVVEYRYIQPTGDVEIGEYEQEHVFYAGLRIRTP